MSHSKWSRLCTFIDRERGRGRGQERAIDMNPPLLAGARSVDPWQRRVVLRLTGLLPVAIC